MFGSETYQEHYSTRLQQVPGTGQTTERRALYPNGSNYTTMGIFGQDSIDLVRGKLRAVVGGRVTAVRFRTLEASNRESLNRPLREVD